MLKINVTTAEAVVAETELITAGRKGLRCAFSFSEDWAGLAKTVIVQGAATRDIALLATNEIVVPAECVNKAQFPLKIGVYGALPDGTIAIPTIWASFGKVLPGAKPSDIPPDELTPDVVAQIQEAAGNALYLARNVQNMADSGAFDGEDGQDGAAATISVGTTTTLPAGSPATVENIGTSSEAVFNFGIPKGDKGDKGNPGTGFPAGGKKDHVLLKLSDTDYDTGWAYPMDLLSDDTKTALLQLAQKVAYIDDDGADYYQDLYDALYPPKDLLYITAVYTQSGTVYDDASLDSLRTDLVVTAKWDDNTVSFVTAYTLSGTLTAGTSTVTVSYNGKTTTFDVAVTARPVLSSISAVYTQSGYVFTTDSLDTLKSGLVVTAHYSDSSTETVSADEYTLSGTLTAGTSTVTVSCGGKTTTFTVTVSEVPAGYNTNGLVFFLDGKTATASSWIDRVGSREFALTNCSLATNGVQFNGSSSYGVFQGSISDDWQDETIEVVFDGRETITSSTILSQPWDDDTEGKCGICMRFGYNNANQPRFAIVYDTDNHPFYYATLNQDKNRVGVNVDRAIYNETAATGTYSTYYGRNRSGNSYVGATMGSNGVASFFKGKILAVRIYNRKLSQAEIVANQQVDATYYEL